MESLCKSCHNIKIDDAFIQEMFAMARKKGEKFVTDEVYDKRLSACDGCSALQYGSTCMHSGSLVSYRAKIVTYSCPHPEGSKWECL